MSRDADPMADFRPDRQIGPLFDRYMLEQDLRQAHPPATFHASSILACGRQQVYGLLGYAPDTSRRRAEWIRDAWVGNYLHDLTLDALRAQGVLLEREFNLPENPYRIGGRVDGVVDLGWGPAVLEIKSLAEKYFRALPSHEKALNFRAQVQLYMHFLRLPTALVLAISRDSQKHAEWRVKYDADYACDLLLRTGQLKRCLDENIIPAAEPGDGCFFCGYRETCELEE